MAASYVPSALSELSGSITTASVSDFAEAVDDRVADLLVEGTGITLTYDDGSGTLTIDAAGGGGGDASTNTSSSVDSEVALFSGTGGKTLKRATGTGLAKLTSGVLSAATAGTDYLAPAAIGSTVQGYDADLAAIAGLADPDADRLLFWDDSAGTYAYLTAGTGLTITGTTITASGGGGGADLGTANTWTAMQTFSANAAFATTGNLLFYHEARGISFSGDGATYNGDKLIAGSSGGSNLQLQWNGGCVDFEHFAGSTVPGYDVRLFDSGFGDSALMTAYRARVVNSGGTGSTFGARFQVQASSTTTNGQDVGDLRFTWADATHATRKGKAAIVVADSSGTDKVGLSVASNGSTADVVIPIANVRDAADDSAASALSPAVPVGGIYRTGSAIKIRVS